jgi:hypothetical protein
MVLGPPIRSYQSSIMVSSLLIERVVAMGTSLRPCRKYTLDNLLCQGASVDSRFRSVNCYRDITLRVQNTFR